MNPMMTTMFESVPSQRQSEEVIEVHSHHHQGVDRLGEDLAVTGWADPDDSIEAIEILRGSASPLHGDAAIGGVINIITRAGASEPSVTARSYSERAE